MESPGNCMTCKEPITPDNDGVSINDGDFFECNDCHHIRTGYNLYSALLYFHNLKPDMYDLQEQDLKNIKRHGQSNNGI